jgi:hypothetical protein
LFDFTERNYGKRASIGVKVVCCFCFQPSFACFPSLDFPFEALTSPLTLQALGSCVKMHLFLTTILSSLFHIRTYAVNASSQRLSLSVLTQRVYHDKFLSPYRAGGDSPRCDGLVLTSTPLPLFAIDAQPLLGLRHAFPENLAQNVYLFAQDGNGHLRP